jgi:hypothetical protein
MNNLFKICLIAIASATFVLNAADCQAQRRSNSKKVDTVVKGKVFFDRKQAKAWNGDKLSIEFPEIKAKLREYVTLPPAPYPAASKTWTLQQKTEWETEFAKTEAGKKVVERNKKLLEAGNSFDIKFEDNGAFVVYDVPPGDYAVQGRVDQEVGDSNYAFEVFGKITIKKDVDVLDLAPIRVEVTPQYERGQVAPPLKVTNYNDKTTVDLKIYRDKGQVVLLNFWSSASPVAAKEQRDVQDTYTKLGKQFNLSLLSVNVDKDRKKALQMLSKNKLLAGSHGFTKGLQHSAIFNYGVRGVPSYWLIDKDGKILINQYEFAKLMKVKPSISQIVSDRLLKKDTPTPAVKEDKKTASAK